MMTYKGLAAVVAIIACGLSHAAAAGTITYNIDFTASHFFTIPNTNSGPYPSVSGSFTVTLDPTLDQALDSTDIKLNSIGIPVDGHPVFTYDTAFELLHVSMDSFGTAAALGTNDFIYTVSLEGGADSFTYVNPDIYYDSSIISNVTVAASTPVPAALPLFITAFTGLGFLGWRSKRGVS